MAEKIKYWWSDDRQFFCMLVNNGIAQATVSLTIEEAEALMDEVMQTPKPPAPGLIDAIAKSIDAWHETHPDLTIGEIIGAFRIVRNQLVESTK